MKLVMTDVMSDWVMSGGN